MLFNQFSMKRVFLILTFTAIAYSVQAQSDKQLLKYIKKSVTYLADDQLEGRRTGTLGEKKANSYIIHEMGKNGLSPIFKYENGLELFVQPFQVKEGLSIEKAKLSFGDGSVLELGKDFSPMAYSKNGTDTINQRGWMKNLEKKRKVILFDVQPMLSENASNVHFDADEEIYKSVSRLATQNPDMIVVYNANDTGLTQSFNPKSKKEVLNTYVINVTQSALQQITAKSNQNIITIEVAIGDKFRNGLNAGGWIDNGAEQTIVLGAHYDHLGYGEDKNSLYAGSEQMIHNGADDNASGTAALLALSRILKTNGNKKYNYLFLAFSGEELGLYGSKYYTDHPAMDLKKISYMINMDMVGRLNDSTHGLTVGGFGTSPAWGQLISLNDPYFKIKVDSAGNGPSDHTSFYRKDIPVLFFFTGTHSDYHKPSDDADKINYEGELKIVRYIESIIEKSSALEQIPFTKTKESATSGKSSFKVSMGIMPDYTYSGNGVHVDGVSDNKPAQKAGIKTGDVIYQLGDFTVSDVQSYMQVLNKMEKGVPVKVKLKRGNEEVEVTVVF